MAIITKYSDYIIQSVEFFLTALNTELEYRDLKGLTNNRIEKISITKQHPLATLMAATLQENVRQDPLRSGIIPAISVTPGSITEGGFTLGQSLQPEIVDDTFINVLKTFQSKTNKQIQADLLITQDQITAIISAYRKAAAGGLRCQVNQFHKNEEINISSWSDSPDVDILMSNLIDSALASLQVGFVGENSGLRNVQYKITKGLTNFNFGRVLFGSEYSLTFLNTYNNYIIYTDDVLSGHDFEGTFEIYGEE